MPYEFFMDYLRKIMWLLMAVVFLISLAIGFGFIFAVKNVNITLESYRYSEWESMSEAQSAVVKEEINEYKQLLLNKYRGTIIAFVNESDIEDCFETADCEFLSCEKVLPCTINIRLKERKEVFAIAVDGGYDVYDLEGNRLRRSENLLSDLDDAPNILVEGQTDSELKDIAAATAIFAEKFSGLRAIVSKIFVSSTDTRNIQFHLRCGIIVRLVDYKSDTEQKMQAAYDVFASLTGEEKLSGTIRASVVAETGMAAATRVPD